MAKLKATTDKCPTCGNVVDTAHIKKEIDIVEGELDTLDAKLELAKSNQEKCDADIESVCKKIEKNQEHITSVERDAQPFYDKIVELQAKVHYIEKANAALQDAVTSAERSVAAAERDLAVQVAKKNPFVEKEQQRRQSLATLQKTLETLEGDIASLEEDVQGVQFWVKGFKDIRLMLISEAMTQFELEVNAALESLGLFDWDIAFATERETASGTSKKEFNVLVKSPSNTDAVAWESWSGGESQRLRLAGTIGLAHLIDNRAGISCNVEFWDEATSYISEVGLVDLIETLKERAVSLGKQIWIVDHTSLSFGMFNKVVTVVKTEDGSFFEESVE